MKTILIAACLCLATLPAHAYQFGKVIPQPDEEYRCRTTQNKTGHQLYTARVCTSSAGSWSIVIVTDTRTGDYHLIEQ